jgi:hypothetical protein
MWSVRPVMSRMIGLKVAKTMMLRDGQWRWLRFVPFGLGVCVWMDWGRSEMRYIFVVGL